MNTNTETNITIRHIDPANKQELRDARKICSKAFFGFSFFWFTFGAPKTALIALVDGKIAGGFFYKLLNSAEKQIGFNSYFFTDPKHNGRGIGKQLFREGISHLRSSGCALLLSYVRDDNVGSWSNFIKNGFVRAPFLSLVSYVGFVQSLKIYIVTLLGFCFGHDFYISVKDKQLIQKTPNSFGQILIFLLVNAALFIPIFIATDSLILSAVTFLGIFIGLVLTSYIGTLFSKRNWSFRFNDGGLLMCGIFSFFYGFLPMSGSWFPKNYENTPEFRRDLALPAITSWLFLFGLAAAAATIWFFLTGLVQILLIFRCLVPLEPFKTYGGQRVYDWNKGVFIVFAAVSVVLVFVVL